MRVRVNVSNSMYVFATTQVSCLGLEENVENDPCKFTVTSRLTNGMVESFVLHSTHPGVCEVWTLRISQILESQRNFLNGILTNTQTHTYRRDTSHKKKKSQISASPTEYQRNHVGATIGPPGAGSSGPSETPGVASSQSSSVSSGPQGGSRRPSRIPQPSRLPQPLRHHPGADLDGPSKMSGKKKKKILMFQLIVV